MNIDNKKVMSEIRYLKTEYIFFFVLEIFEQFKIKSTTKGKIIISEDNLNPIQLKIEINNNFKEKSVLFSFHIR